MQRMRPHISPIPIQPQTGLRRPRPRDLKYPTRNPERRIRSYDFDARDPFRSLSPLSGGEIALLATICVDGGDFGARDVGEGFGSAEVCKEGAIALEDVGFLRTCGDGVGSIGP